MLGEERYWRDARALADRAGAIAREVADAAGREVRVAGSLPPLFESHRIRDLSPHFDPSRERLQPASAACGAPSRQRSIATMSRPCPRPCTRSTPLCNRRAHGPSACAIANRFGSRSTPSNPTSRIGPFFEVTR